MNLKYWNELTPEEVDKINKEWKSSDWRKNAIENSRKELKEKVYNISYILVYILEMISLVSVIFSIIRMFIILSSESLDDSFIVEPIVISGICFFTFGIMANHLRKKYYDKYVEDKEFEKWLLKNHNTVK